VFGSHFVEKGDEDEMGDRERIVGALSTLSDSAAAKENHEVALNSIFSSSCCVAIPLLIDYIGARSSNPRDAPLVVVPHT